MRTENQGGNILVFLFRVVELVPDAIEGMFDSKYNK